MSLGLQFLHDFIVLGGKGKSVHFDRIRYIICKVMEQMANTMNVSSFFMMDENFRLNRPRSRQLHSPRPVQQKIFVHHEK